MIGFVIALLVWRKDKQSFLFCSFRVLFSYRVRKRAVQSQKVGMRNMFLIKHLKLGLQSKHSTLTIFSPEKTCFYAPNKTFDFHVLRWWASNPRPQAYQVRGTPLSYIPGWLPLNLSTLHKASAAGLVRLPQLGLATKADDLSEPLNTRIARREQIPVNCPVTSSTRTEACTSCFSTHLPPPT